MQTNKQLYGDDFPKIIGQAGGLKRVPKGFSINRELAVKAGRIGGTKSRRGAEVTKQPKVAYCRYCHTNGHYAYSCELRQKVMDRKRQEAARKRVEREQHEMDRQKMQGIASKWGVKRPW